MKLFNWVISAYDVWSQSFLVKMQLNLLTTSYVRGQNVVLTCKSYRYWYQGWRKLELSEDLTIAPSKHYQRTKICSEAQLWRTDGRQIMSMAMCIQTLVKICPIIIKILSKTSFLKLIEGRYSIAKTRKMMLYNTNIDLFNDNVYTKNCLNSAHPFSRYWAKKQFLTSIKGRNFVTNLRTMTIYNTNLDLVNDNVYTKCG